ncbi:MAG: neutral/alkaline ceramidase [Micromonosporaceae bacterium]
MAEPAYLVGRGIADITGEPAECGMLGYGKQTQQTAGIHTRLRARAFVFADPAADRRILLVVCDLPLIFSSVHQEVLRRLAARYGDRYPAPNTMITATHTHCGPGGYSHHELYNGTTGGFRPKTYAAIVDGITEAAVRAHDDLAPATLRLAYGELRDASVNRSRVAFDRNPAADRAAFPDAIDPQTTLLTVERDGRPVGAVNWFATHGTSMTNRNRLISGDNKGYAAYRWERLVAGIDYADTAPGFVAAFAQTNAGDMSPNLNRRPGSGPTEDELANTRIIGTRQYEAAAKLLTEPGVTVTGGLDYRLTTVDLSDVEVRPEFTPDGRPHRTSPPYGGAAAFAGTDEGPGFPGFRQERNPVWDRLSRHVVYPLSRRLADAQAPKGLVLPGGALNRVRPMVAERFPIQLLRIGPLHLIGIPGEVTIVAGLRLRRTVAAIVGAELRDVLVAGYSNGYLHYVTTPEEYDAQRYEGGSTLFGRWELPALAQTAAALATALRDGVPAPSGPGVPDLAGRQRIAKRKTPADRPLPGRRYGDVLVAPDPAYRPGERVTVRFCGAYPNHDLRRGDSYLRVQREHDGGWHTVADDGDWNTTFHWVREAAAGSVVTVTWDVPADAAPGRYRVVYDGHARGANTGLRAFTGVSSTFQVKRGDGDAV